MITSGLGSEILNNFRNDPIIATIGVDMHASLGSRTEEDGEAVYARFAGLLRYIAVTAYGVPLEDAESLVHDAFVAYLTQADLVQNAKAWLVGTVRNGCKQYWKRRKREVAMPDESSFWPDEKAAGRADQLMDTLVATKVMRQLGDRDRDLLERFYLRGESTSAIADALGTTAGTIQVLLHHSRKKAQTLYGELMEVPA
jgi:RNA polymerase sigma factor (sigma-70 family)